MASSERDKLAEMIKDRDWIVGVLTRGTVLRNLESAAREVAATDARVLDDDEEFVRAGDLGASAFFIVSGNVDVFVRGQRVATRGPGDFIGEMALLNVNRERTASLRATRRTAVIELANADVERIFGRTAGAWRGVAEQLARRLEERTSLIPRANEQPRMFLGSSRERLPVVEGLTTELSRIADVRPWPSIFPPSSVTVASLLDEAHRCDFAAFIFAPDDTATIRGRSVGSVRDNVVYEAGLFAGVFGSVERVFIVTPQGADVHILSDLQGLNPVYYREKPELNVAGAAADIRKVIRSLGTKPLRRT